MKNNRIERVMNESLSHMVFSSGHRQAVYAQVMGEKMMKRKTSIALVFAMVLVLVAGIALAVVLSLRDAGRQVVQTEQTEGYYAQWPIDKKTALVGALVELGYAENTAEVAQLLSGALAEAEATRVADGAMTAFTGLAVSEISFMEIMEAAWGPFGQWTAEDQAWSSQLMVDMGIQQADHTLYVMPEGAIDEVAAIAIARAEMAKGYGIDEATLDLFQMEVSFQVPEFVAAAGDTQAWWYVGFFRPENMPEGKRALYDTELFIHPDTGALYEPIEYLIAVRDQMRAEYNEAILQKP
ncbi:MAG: hypothetical protein LBN04_00705 [Oscillospiraceae bacterium]|nr:hypothetical protein [Oscillospiraceae bacterium]